MVLVVKIWRNPVTRTVQLEYARKFSTSGTMLVTDKTSDGKNAKPTLIVSGGDL
jgi:hypothetical protein